MPMDAFACPPSAGRWSRRCWRTDRQDLPAQPGRNSAADPGPGGELPPAAVGQPQPAPAPAHRSAPGEPAEPPMFCMLLRKYLAGGKILALRQPPMERLRSWLSRPPMRWGTKLAAVW